MRRAYLRRHKQIEPLFAGVGRLLDSDTTTTSTTHALGYGEMSVSSMDRLLDELDMGPDARFLDVGSGLGQPVFLAALRGIPSTGIEVLETYVHVSRDVLSGMQHQFPDFAKTPVRFLLRDAATFDYTPYTHIYAYDYVFRTKDEVLERGFHAGVARAMTQNPRFGAFVSYKPLSVLLRQGFPAGVIDETRTRTIRMNANLSGEWRTAHIYYHTPGRPGASDTCGMT